jgi:hypothetical protein
MGPSDGFTAVARAGGYIGFEPDDWLHSGRTAGLPKGVCAMQVAVIRHGESRHAHFGRGLKERPQSGRSVKHRVLRVVMEMDEIHSSS